MSLSLSLATVLQHGRQAQYDARLLHEYLAGFYSRTVRAVDSFARGLDIRSVTE